jgi:hypothetical protein
MICERVGKNYLDITGRGGLDMPNETNLPYIYERIKYSKDLVDYHILNSNDFMSCLSNIFHSFSVKNDKMGMGTIGRIVKLILASNDMKLVEVLLGDPSFDLLL